MQKNAVSTVFASAMLAVVASLPDRAPERSLISRLAFRAPLQSHRLSRRAARPYYRVRRLMRITLTGRNPSLDWAGRPVAFTKNNREHGHIAGVKPYVTKTRESRGRPKDVFSAVVICANCLAERCGGR